jgi:hypothetical protein
MSRPYDREWWRISMSKYVLGIIVIGFLAYVFAPEIIGVGTPEEETSFIPAAKKGGSEKISNTPRVQPKQDLVAVSLKDKYKKEFPKKTSKTIKCGNEVQVFDPEDPSQRVGVFVSGTKLNIGNPYEGGYSFVKYSKPSGEFVVALARAEELVPAKPNTKIENKGKIKLGKRARLSKS